MRHHRLHVVTAIANPVRWLSRIRLYKDFEQHMLDSGVELTVVECAYGDRLHELGGNKHINHIPVRASGRSMMWNKECLLNIGIHRLPDSAKYIVTADADVMFRRKDWAIETLHALQHFHVVQPWSDCYDLGPNGEHLALHQSFCRLVQERRPIIQGPQNENAPYQFGHPGYVWGWTRGMLDACGGLVETAALGAADHHMALALIGRVEDSIPNNINEGYKHPLRMWEHRAFNYVKGQLGHIAGTIEHAFHGPKQKRYYVERWPILIDNHFDPHNDLKRNSWGVMELSGNKPKLCQQIDHYFRIRNEDSNVKD